MPESPQPPALSPASALSEPLSCENSHSSISSIMNNKIVTPIHALLEPPKLTSMANALAPVYSKRNNSLAASRSKKNNQPMPVICCISSSSYSTSSTSSSCSSILTNLTNVIPENSPNIPMKDVRISDENKLTGIRKRMSLVETRKNLIFKTRNFSECRNTTKKKDDKTSIYMKQKYLKHSQTLFYCVGPIICYCSKNISMRIGKAHIWYPIVEDKSDKICESILHKSLGDNWQKKNDKPSYFFQWHFKPALKPLTKDKFREMKSSDQTRTSMCCIFCGRNSKFNEIGSLHGPYFLNKSELSKLHFHSQTNQIESSVYNSELPISTTENIQNTKPTFRSYSQSNKILGEISSRIFLSNGEYWVHRDCALWAPGTFLKGDGVIGGIVDALLITLNEKCVSCGYYGSVFNCRIRGCHSKYHYFCAINSNCTLEKDNFSMLCGMH